MSDEKTLRTKRTTRIASARPNADTRPDALVSALAPLAMWRALRAGQFGPPHVRAMDEVLFSVTTILGRQDWQAETSHKRRAMSASFPAPPSKARSTKRSTARFSNATILASDDVHGIIDDTIVASGGI
jgi:hypothetical protein